MMSLSLFFLLFNLMIMVLFIMLSLLFTNSKETSEMSSKSFECGFESVSANRPSFCLHFFCVAMVFLIFDLEVIIFLPILFFMGSFTNLFFYSMMCIVLFFGLFIEWYDGSLEWSLY